MAESTSKESRWAQLRNYFKTRPLSSTQSNREPATEPTAADDHDDHEIDYHEPADHVFKQKCSEKHLAEIAPHITDWRAVSPFLGLTEAEEIAIL